MDQPAHSGTPPAPDPGELRAPRAADSGAVESIVEEIRQGLAQISARELELRQREFEVGQQYRDLRQAARVAAHEEYEQSQQRLAQQSAELNAQAVEIAAQRARLTQLAEQLRARQVDIEQQRSELTLRAQQSRQRVETLRSWQARQQQTFEQRVEILRRQEEELRTRVQRAEENIARERKELARQRAALELRAERLSEAEQNLAAGQAAAATQLEAAQVLTGRAARDAENAERLRTHLEAERQQLLRAAEEVEQRRAQFEAEHAALEEAARTIAGERAALAEQRTRSGVDARHASEAQNRLAGERAALEQRAAELESARRQLEEQRREAGLRERQLAAAQDGLANREAEAAAAQRALETERERLGTLHAEQRAAAAVLDAERAAQQERETRLQAHEAELRAARERLAAEGETLRCALAQEQAAARAEWERTRSEAETLLNAREQALAQRAAALAAEQAGAAERADELACRDAELARREQELAGQQALASARGEALSAAEAGLQDERAALEQARAALASDRSVIEAELARATDVQAELADQRAALAAERERLAQHAAGLGRERTELAEQRALVDQEHRHLAEERAALAGRGAELEAQAGALERQRAALAAEQQRLADAAAGVSAERAALEQRAAELERAERLLSGERAALSDERQRLDCAGAVVEEQQRARAAQDAELDEKRRQLQQNQADVERATRAAEQVQAQLDAQRAELAAREAELARQASELSASMAAASSARHDELVTESQRLESWEAELLLRQAELDRGLQRVRTLEQGLAERDRELAAHRAELAAAEAELRQAHLALESRHADVARAPQATPPAGAAAHPAPLPDRGVVQRPAGRSPGRARTFALAAATGLIAGLGWLLAHPAVYRASVPLRIAPASAERAAVHRRGLVDPGLLGSDPHAARWRAACEAGQVTTGAEPGAGQLRVQVAGSSAEVSELAQAAARAYAARASAPGGVDPPAGLAETSEQGARVREALAAAQRQLEIDQAALASLPEADQSATARAETERLDAELAAAAGALDGARAELAGLVAVEAPAGVVPPTACEEALAHDELYREDRDELRATALQYRTELAVAMLQVNDPLQAARGVLDEANATLAEQRALEPPADVAATLEECALALGGLAAVLPSFAEQWRTWLDATQQMDVREDVAALLTHQTTVADGARRLGDELGAVTTRIGERIAALGSETDSSTRAVVVAAVLRNEHATWKAAVDVLTAAVAKVTLAVNFELDTLDRKLRGLRTRLVSRREAVAQRLQLEADQLAQAAHAARIDEVRTGVRQLERQREELVAGLLAAFQKLRLLEEHARQREELASRIRQRTADIEWHTARAADLERELARLQRSADISESVEAGAPTLEVVATGRSLGAILAGVVVFIGTLLACHFSRGR